MSTRDGLEPSPSPDSDTHTQPIPGDEAAPDHRAGAAATTRPQPPESPRPDPAASDPTAPPADQAWPPSWGQAPSSREPAPATTDSTTWTQPKAAQGPSWARQPAESDTAGTTWPQPTGPEARAGQPQPGWAQGGGGHPTVPAWGERSADAGSPRSRRPSRWLAGVVAGVVLLAAGYGVSEALDRDGSAPTSAGIPTAGSAPVAATPVPSGQEPAAAVAKTLLPTVVEIRRGSDGLGSGFVYDEKGYIMTAAHVIEGADEVEIRLYDGTRLQGEVLGTDEVNDVGVVKVDRTGLAAAPLAVGQGLQVGQLAVAIGSPFGLNETVTAGIVSSTDRLIDGREVIQTDAPINPGNSGGVLANRQGQVIGINSAIRPGDNSNGNVGIGFAVPIDIAAKSATAIVQGKQIRIGYLGVTPSPTTGGRDGALVAQVASGSPAARAGVQVGDLVVKVDGQAIQDYNEMIARIRAHKPGDEVTLGVVRGGNETTITATLAQRPAG